MANPQPTDAHLRIAHSINEAIMTRDFTKRQRKILDLILRLSWGCGKKDAYIPRQCDFSAVGVHEVDIKKELDWLEVSKVITRQNSFYGFNKDYDQWQVSRVKPFNPEKLSELLRLNLNNNRPELSKTLSGNLVKHKEKTKENTKSATSKLASPKEILKKDDRNISKTLSNTNVKSDKRNRLPVAVVVTAATTGEKENNDLNILRKIYQENIGAVTPVIIEGLRDILWKYPFHWFGEAVKEAVNSEHRNLKYIEAILERWKVEGFKMPKGKKDDRDKFKKQKYGHLVVR